MDKEIETWQQLWDERLHHDLPDPEKQSQRESILRWLVGPEPSTLAALTPAQQKSWQQSMTFRYQTLTRRYLNQLPTQAYRNLINRLGSLVLLRDKVRTWVALSRDRQREVTDVLQELIQEMLTNDRLMQGEIAWIQQCSDDEKLRNALLLTSLEEYCLRPVRTQPLIAYRFINYLRRQSRGGVTHVPQKQTVRFISDEIDDAERENQVSLLDAPALSYYQHQCRWSEEQARRLEVQAAFEAYLLEKQGEVAVQWLRLYLQGHSPEAIASILKLPIQQIYRLREKVGYHALRVFAIKREPALVANWLETSLQSHHLGLTPQQWEAFFDELSPEQQQLLLALQVEPSPAAIAQQRNCKLSQVINEWTQIYLKAQSYRCDAKRSFEPEG